MRKTLVTIAALLSWFLAASPAMAISVPLPTLPITRPTEAPADAPDPCAVDLSLTGLRPAYCATKGDRLEPQAIVPCVDIGCRVFAVTTAHGFLTGIINAAVGFIGFALLAAYFYAAGLWLTSRGESGPITTAKKIFVEATIGLVIVMISFFLVRAVITLKG